MCVGNDNVAQWDRKQKEQNMHLQKQYLFDNNSIIYEGSLVNDCLQDTSSDISPVSLQNICLN